MSKKVFSEIASQHGIEFDYMAGGHKHPRTGDIVNYTLMLDAPKGRIFNTSGCHCEGSLNGLGGAKIDWEQAIKALRYIIEDGFSDCEDEDCDVCK